MFTTFWSSRKKYDNKVGIILKYVQAGPTRVGQWCSPSPGIFMGPHQQFLVGILFSAPMVLPPGPEFLFTALNTYSMFSKSSVQIIMIIKIVAGGFITIENVAKIRYLLPIILLLLKPDNYDDYFFLLCEEKKRVALWGPEQITGLGPKIFFTVLRAKRSKNTKKKKELLKEQVVVRNQRRKPLLLKHTNTCPCYRIRTAF